MNGKNLSFSEREQIERLLRAGYRQSEIARTLGVHRSTISREIKRGMTEQFSGAEFLTYYKYTADKGQLVHNEVSANKGPRDLKIGNDQELANYIEDMILRKFSPDAIIGRIRATGMQFMTSICTKTVYNYVDKGVFLNVTRKSLWMQGKRKRKYDGVQPKKAPHGRSIEQRPKEILRRAEFGHWEMDTVVSGIKNGKALSKECLLVLTERMTRYEIIFKIDGKTQDCVVSAVNQLERRYGSKFRSVFKTITMDNGGEFRDQNGIETSMRIKAPRTTAYYCHPYTSAERGSNENQNKFIRRFVPKGADISQYSTEEIQRAQDFMNNYPRRILGYMTPAELFERFANANAVAKNKSKVA